MNSEGRSRHWPRTLLAGLCGGIAWIAAMAVFFGPAQALLADPELQSGKFLAVFAEIEPLPRTVASGWILFAGLLVLGVLYAAGYRIVRLAARGRWWRKGATFALLAWLLMVPWFEFYLPWNVMHEPLPLVLLEAALWFLTLMAVGLAIAGVYEWRLDAGDGANRADRQ